MMTKSPIKIVTLIAIATIAGCSAAPQNGEEAKQIKTVNVHTTTIQPETFERYLHLVGTVESTNDVQLSAEVSGRIEQYYVDKGEYIAEGQPILKINDDKLQAQKTQLQAQTLAAKEKYERLLRVFKQDSIGSEMNIIQAKTDYLQSKAALQQVNVNLQNTTVRAPFGAVLDQKYMETGEMASPGQQLVRLIGAGSLKITAGVPARFASTVNTGDKAKIWFDFNPQDTLELPITFVSRSIDESSRTFDIEIALAGNSETYKVDMNTNVLLQTLVRDSAIVIGQEYIYPADENYVVYTLAENDSSETIANQQVVTLGPTYKNRIVVESGLQPGDKLLTTGSSFLQDSMRVEVTEGNTENLAQQRTEIQ